MTERIIQLGILVFILGGWQLGVTAGFIDVFFFQPHSISSTRWSAGLLAPASIVTIGASAVSPRITSLIGAAENAVLLVLERSSYFETGACAEKSEFFIRPERYQFVLGSRTPDR
ncbi:hypothetical protein [Rhizobium leguminosarum]|uniref:hypothetical protein n=1 Tax=Rhizobium leguminosarum TaxID=384 RepID=UPI003D7B83EB